MKFQLTSKKIALNLKVSDMVPDKVKTDLKRYKQVLFNLMGNASKFTFQGSITVSIEFKNNQLISTVIDTGIGV